jgi:iron complex outermembrane receptor protein
MKFSGAAVSVLLLAGPAISASSARAQAVAPAAPEAPIDIAQMNPAIAEQITVTGQFISQAADSATKLDVPNRDTPYSVETYTGSFMRAIETQQVSDLYRYMTGLQRAGQTSYDLTLRGFTTSAADRNAIMTDGLPGLAVRFGSPPTIGTDHIEVVKGPASLLYGESQPGGFVNIVTKTPQDTPYTILSTRGTTDAGGASHLKGYDVALDSTGPVPGSDDRLLYRFIVQNGYDNSFQDNSFDQAFYIAPMVTWKIDDATTATVQLEFRSTKTNYMNTSLIVPMGAENLSRIAPITTDYTNPDGYQTESGETETLRVAHRFGGGAVWNLGFRDVQHRDTSHAFDITGIDAKDPTRLDLRARGQLNTRTYDFVDTNVTVPFETLGLGHRTIFGVNLGREVDDFERTQYCALNTLSSTKVDPSCNIGSNVYTVSISDPDYAGIPGLAAFGAGKIGTGGSARNRTYTTSLAEGVYGSDYMTLSEHWKASVGVRYAWEKQENNADLLEQTATVASVASDVLPQGGIVYQPTEQLSFYVSESTSFTPVPANTRGTIGTSTFQPTTGEGFEAGVKAQLFGGRVDVTAAYFRIEQHNVLTPYSGNDPAICPSGSTCQLQVGAARSEGEELEASARPVEGLTLLAGYAHTDARVAGSTANGPIVGSVLPNSPVDAAHLWSRYDFAEGALDGFGVGLGYSYVGDRKPFSPTAKNPVAVTLPAYQVVDLGLYYALPHDTELTFKVSNLLGAQYYESGSTQNNYINIQPGTPRTVALTLRTAF